MRTLYILALSAILFSACETDVNRPLPEHTSQLVLYSTMEPGDSVRLYLSRSYGPLERVTVNDLLIDDAEVKFWIDGVQMTDVLYRDSASFFGFGDSSAYYLGRDAVVETGDLVTIEVSHPDYGTARGETTIPTAGTVVKAELIQNAFRTVFSSTDAYTQSILRLTFNDMAGVRSFYRVQRGFFSFRDPDFPTQLQFGALTVFGPAVPTSDGGFETVDDYAENPDGGEIVIDFLCEMPNAFAPVDQWKEVTLDSIWVSTEFANVDYAEYQQKLLLQQRSGGNGISLTPNEPVELYSNIDGGYGVVGAFTVKTDSLAF